MQLTFKQGYALVTTLTLITGFVVFPKPGMADDQSDGQEACASAASVDEADVEIVDDSDPVHTYDITGTYYYCEYNVNTGEAVID